jgi:hypothetical protein
MRGRVLTVGVALVVLAPASAHADPDDWMKPPKRDIFATLAVGPTVDANGHGGALFALSALLRQDAAGAGLTFEYGTAGSHYQLETFAAEAGIFLPFPRLIRLGVLGAVGVHSYSSVGSQYLLSSTGAHDTIAFAGMRLFAGVEIGKRARLHVGLQGVLDDDFWRTDRSGAPTDGGDDRFGTVRSGLLLAVGGASDY